MPSGPKVVRTAVKAPPVRSVVTGTNATLLAEVARLYIPAEAKVLDLTYGRGGWWKEYTPKNLTTNDLHTPADHHLDFTEPMPESWHGSFDVVAFDPPYVSVGGVETTGVPEMFDRYGMGAAKGHREIFTDIAKGMAEASTLLKAKGLLLVKAMDYVESGEIRWGSDVVRYVAAELGLKRVDEFIHFSGTGPQPDGRRQVHSRRAHSFLFVLRRGAR